MNYKIIKYYRSEVLTNDENQFNRNLFQVNNLIIMEELEVFLSSDQLTTCPICGLRTEIVSESENNQLHKCLSQNCNFKFILEFENEDEL